MSNLPVIVGFGGVNAAGRSSFHHGYRRLVLDTLPSVKKAKTLASLAQMMGLADHQGDIESAIILGTLIRQLDPSVLDASNIDYNHLIKIDSSDNASVFETKTKFLPESLPENWRVENLSVTVSRVVIEGEQRLLVPSQRKLKVQAAAQLPTGFDPGKLYGSRNHPRGLQMTVYGASDALGSMGIPWDDVLSHVAPDQVSVYAGSGMSQLDLNGNGGMMSARFNGKRVTSKQCPLGFAEMPADFINAYVLGSLGTTGTSMGACASFLYNLRMAIGDIQSGRSRVAVVGNSEAPLVPDIFEGYAAMGALATDKELSKLDNGILDYRRACRPFGDNCGFTLAESSQFVILFDDTLAMELGAQVFGSVADVFINADGFKKSISAPGAGNYLTVARALASARALVGERAVRENSFVQAHGTGTPQNRVTESDVLNRVAKQFGIESWPVVAVKNYLGHSIGVAGGDQLAVTLGIWEDGILPGITSIDHVADDVHTSNLAISNRHVERDPTAIDVAIINAKGFGGNNASATIISPQVTNEILQAKHRDVFSSKYQSKLKERQEAAAEFDEAMVSGKAKPIYLYDHAVMDGDALDLQANKISVPRFGKPVNLNVSSPWSKWLDR